MGRPIDTNAQEWLPVRPELTTGVSGKVLQDKPMKMVLTRVEAGGIFRPHRDKYNHLFHILSGKGVFEVQGEEYELGAGMTLQIQAGSQHGYRNCGSEELLLISVNNPAE